MKKLGSICLLLLLPIGAYSQFYESGQDPSYLRWQQIRSARYTLIFPEVYTKSAVRFADILDQAIDSIPASLNHTPRSIPIIFHACSNTSNGFVVWAPRRTELFTLPPQDQYAQDWLEQLALHEYRHVVQIDKLNKHFSRALNILGGEQMAGMVSGLLPQWFLEGDAVHSETAFSKSGRGRLPSFDMELRTLWLEQKKPYSFNKMLRGSYKNYIPDHYQLGYKMSSWLRDQYGQQIFDSAILNTSKYPYTFYPFYTYLYRKTGIRKSRLHIETFSHLEVEWRTQQPMRSQELVPQIWLVPPRKGYTSYRFPQLLNDSILIAEKTGMDNSPRLVALHPNGKETLIKRTGYGPLVRLSLKAGQLLWTEEKKHVRWQHKGSTQIVKWDSENGKTITVSRKSNRLAPALSPDGRSIVAVECEVDGTCRLVFSSTSRKHDDLYISAPRNEFLQQPCWIDSSCIAVLLQDQQGKRLMAYSLQTRNWKKLFGPTFEEIGDLSASKSWLFFRAGFTGLSQLFALSLRSGNMFQITNDPYGAFYPSSDADEKMIVFSSYSKDGFNLAEIPLDSTGWIPYDQITGKHVQMYENVSAREGKAIDFFRDSMGRNANLPLLKPYRKTEHLFRVHSWLPFYVDYDALMALDPTVYPGFSLLSQNLLGTSFASVAFASRSGKPYLESKYTYKGLFPVIELSHSYGDPLRSYPADTLKGTPSEKHLFNLQIYIPLNFSYGSWIRKITPSASYSWRNDRYLYQPENKYRSGMGSIQYRVFGYQYQLTSVRDLAPRCGQLFELIYEHTPFESQQYGAIGSIRAGLYLPGPIPHHSIALSWTGQKQFLGNNRYFFYHSFVSLPGGYPPINTETLQKISFRYYLPLLYPDLSLGTPLYLKRVRATLLMDFASGTGVRQRKNGQVIVSDRNFASAGGELLIDLHLLQIIFPITVGVQVLYQPIEKTYGMYPVVRMDLTSF